MNPLISQEEALLRRFSLLVSCVLMVVIFVIAVFAVRDRGMTGKLIITAPTKTAAISVSRANQTAQLVGTGSARIRLIPGTYQITAGVNGKTVTTIAQVSLGKTTTSVIPYSMKPVVASPDTVNFQNLQSLVPAGLTTTQVHAVRLLLFDFKRSSTTINISNAQPGSYDPNDPNAMLSVDFTVSIDGTQYAAVASYADLTNVQLTLQDSGGVQVFSKDSSSLNQ